MIKVAFFDAKVYDRPSFEQYGLARDMKFKFLETKLTEDTADLAKGCDAVCVFVNDTVNKEVIDRLYANLGGGAEEKTAADKEEKTEGHGD